MDIEKVKEKFGSWSEPFQPFIESEDFDKIFATLIALKKRGRTICPFSSQTFRTFQQTPFESLKAVFVFDDPSAKMESTKCVADGIALGCSNTGKPNIALAQFYRAMEQDLSTGLIIDMVDSPDLSYLSNQGVLLVNAALTVEINKPGSHIDLWKDFMTFFFLEIINTYASNLPVIFAGRFASQYSQLTIPFHHMVFELPAPGAVGTPETPWASQGIFKQINQILHYNGDTPIKWYLENEQEQLAEQVDQESGTTF